MAFIRSSEPFQEPPPRRSRGMLAIGLGVLLILFVPLLVVISQGSGTAPASAVPSAGPSSRPRMPPLPPPGAPWPPPPGAPQPPECVLEYHAAAGGGTGWTSLISVPGELAVATGSAGDVRRQTLKVPVGVGAVALSAPIAADHHLRATLSSGDGRSFTCLVGPEA